MLKHLPACIKKMTFILILAFSATYIHGQIFYSLDKHSESISFQKIASDKISIDGVSIVLERNNVSSNISYSYEFYITNKTQENLSFYIRFLFGKAYLIPEGNYYPPEVRPIKNLTGKADGVTQELLYWSDIEDRDGPLPDLSKCINVKLKPLGKSRISITASVLH